MLSLSLGLLFGFTAVGFLAWPSAQGRSRFAGMLFALLAVFAVSYEEYLLGGVAVALVALLGLTRAHQSLDTLPGFSWPRFLLCLMVFGSAMALLAEPVPFHHPPTPAASDAVNQAFPVWTLGGLLLVLLLAPLVLRYYGNRDEKETRGEGGEDA